MGWVNLYQSFEPLMSLGKNLSHFIKQACLLEVVGISVLWGFSGDVGRYVYDKGRDREGDIGQGFPHS